MLLIIMALIGLPAGVVLDVLIGMFATEVVDDEDEEDSDSRADSPGLSLHAESGSMRVEHDASGTWRRRAIVVAATAMLFGVAAARYDSAVDLVIVCAYIGALIICAGTDLLSYRVPNAVTYPAIVGAFAIAALLPDANFYDGLFGGLLAGGILLIPSVVTGGAGMGMGDVKLALFAGLALGFQLVPIALLVMALGGGAVALLLLLLGRRKRREPIPYAPFIAAGALVTLLGLGTTFTHLT